MSSSAATARCPWADKPVVQVDPDDPGASVASPSRDGRPSRCGGRRRRQMLPLAARLAAELGLAHNPVEAIVAAADKAMQRRLWAEPASLSPPFRSSPPMPTNALVERRPRSGLSLRRETGSLSASRGVLRADDEAERARRGDGDPRHPGRNRPAATRADPARRIRARMGTEHRRPAHRRRPGGHRDLRQARHAGRPDLRGDLARHTVPPARRRCLPRRRALRNAPRRRWGCVTARSTPSCASTARAGEARPVMLELAARSIGGLCSRSLRFLGGMSLEMMILLNAWAADVSPPAARRRRCPHAAGGTRRRAGKRRRPGRGPGCSRESPVSRSRFRGADGAAPAMGRSLSRLPLRRGPRHGDVEAALRGAQRKLRAIIC